MFMMIPALALCLTVCWHKLTDFFFEPISYSGNLTDVTPHCNVGSPNPEIHFYVFSVYGGFKFCIFYFQGLAMVSCDSSWRVELRAVKLSFLASSEDREPSP